MIKAINKRIRNKKGFTLIELVVVIAIIGILAAIAIPRFTGVRENANESVVIANLKSIQTAVELYISQENTNTVDFDDDDGTLLGPVLGTWPSGPGATTYSVVDGIATANIDSDIPYPTNGVEDYDDID